MDQIFPFIGIFSNAIGYTLVLIYVAFIFGAGAEIGRRLLKRIFPDGK